MTLICSVIHVGQRPFQENGLGTLLTHQFLNIFNFWFLKECLIYFISMINENFGLQLHIMLNACVSSSVSSANTRHGIECCLTLFVSPHVLQPLILFFLSSCFSELFTFPGPTAPCLTSLRVVCDTKARWWSMRQHTLLSIWNIQRRRNWRQQYLFCSCFAAHPNQRWGSLQSGPWIRSMFWIIYVSLQ